MSRRLLAAVPVCCTLIVQAQTTWLPADPHIDAAEAQRHVIRLESTADYNANSVYNELPYALWQGGFIDRDLRQRTADELKDRNSAGYALTGRLSWTGPDSLFGHARWRPLVSLAHHSVSGVTFTEDLYALTFFGNAAYAGEQAVLGPSEYVQMQYQTAGFGIRDSRSRSFLRVDMVVGQSLAQANVDWASLNTAVDGRQLRTTVLAEYLASDTAGSAFGRNNGLGAALSGRWEGPLRKGGRLRLNFTLEDLGFVQWNANSVRLEKDTAFTFEGMEVVDLFDLDGVLIGGDQLLDTFNLRYSTGSFTTLLPFRAAVGAELALDSLWSATFTVEQRYLPGYVPQVTAQAVRKLGTTTLLGASLSYGGFGGLRVGLSSRFRLGEHVLMELGVPHVPGFLLGGTRGLGGMAAVTVGF